MITRKHSFLVFSSFIGYFISVAAFGLPRFSFRGENYHAYCCSSLFLSWTRGNDFDFSSNIGWEQFYRTEPSTITEWHQDSVSLGALADYIVSASKDILMAGCGTSYLPSILQSQCPTDVHVNITLLDSSQTCMDQLRARYNSSSMNYVVGDATHMNKLFTAETFDAVVDKGLLDAFLCGDGWEIPVQRFLQGVATVLRPDGYYLVVSYQLPLATKEELDVIAHNLGLQWEFDLDGFTKDENVKVSMARPFFRLR